MKLRTVSGRLEVSLTHTPGRGSGIFDGKTGSQAEFDEACSLNFPLKNYLFHYILLNKTRTKKLTIESSMCLVDIETADSRANQAICAGCECGVELGFVRAKLIN